MPTKRRRQPLGSRVYIESFQRHFDYKILHLDYEQTIAAFDLCWVINLLEDMENQNELSIVSPAKLIALVTGANQGIGYRVAKTLAANGARVCLMARRPDPRRELETEINNAGGKLAIPGDMSKPEDIENAVRLTVEAFGGLHLAINNAGVSGEYGLLHMMTIENRRMVLGINLDGIFYGMKYQIPPILNGCIIWPMLRERN